MHLTLVRHGHAAAPTNEIGDAGRCLSAIGRREARATGAALAERGVAPTRVWCSPLVRAVQTTELIVGQLSFAGEVESRDDLYPDSSPRSLVAALQRLGSDEDVLVVGHMPYMSAAASELLDVRVGGFATAAALRLEITSLLPRKVTLGWHWAGRFL